MSQDVSQEQQAARFELLYRIGIALSAERDRDRLVETILLEAKKLCNADGGTLYLVTDDDHLRFAIMRSDSLGIERGGTTGETIDLPPIPIRDGSGAPNHKNVATYCASCKKSVNIPDAYSARDFDFSGTKKFDQSTGYRSTSFLTIPLFSSENEVIGVLQLINARDRESGEIVPFAEADQKIVEALSSQAGIALDNQQLLEGQKILLEAFIKLIAAAIDAKSPYTGAHCERVPVLTELLAKEACEAREGPLAAFDLSDEEWYELRIAAWLHDCGKVTTPVHVMDKATKLETINDRIEVVRERFEILRRDVRIAYLERMASGDGDPATHEKVYETELAGLASDLEFLERANIGGEYLDPEKKARIRTIGRREYTARGEVHPLLTPEEIENLTISRGTLTDEERITINGHMVQTIKMLEALPFPRHLRRVPEYAGGHHEKMDGSGYPKGLWAGDMSIPARIMAIADVFEALTAQDRPYKPGKTLSESMRIMGFMKRDNHLDPDLFDLFVRSRVYRQYGERFLPPELIDDVDEAALLAIEPKPFEPADEATRRQRWEDFLPEYRDR